MAAKTTKAKAKPKTKKTTAKAKVMSKVPGIGKTAPAFALDGHPGPDDVDAEVCRRLARHVLLGVGVVLVGGDRDQAEEEAVEDAEAGEDVADEVVQAGGAAHERPQDRPDEHRPQPVEADERPRQEQRQG